MNRPIGSPTSNILEGMVITSFLECSKVCAVAHACGVRKQARVKTPACLWMCSFYETGIRRAPQGQPAARGRSNIRLSGGKAK
jgi:hypothetical protein